MRILFCGDRKWTCVRAVGEALENFDPEVDIIVHGAAKGADTIAGILADWMGFCVESYPADWEKFGKAAGPIRNKQMLDSGIDQVMAFHDEIANSKGTKDMCKIAAEAGIEVNLYTH